MWGLETVQEFNKLSCASHSIVDVCSLRHVYQLTITCIINTIQVYFVSCLLMLSRTMFIG